MITVDPDKVRKSIISRLSEADLPDDQIADELRGLREVRDRYADADNATGEDLAHLNDAAVYFTASYLARTIRFVSFSATTNFNQEPVNLSKRADELWEEALRELAEVISPDSESVAISSGSGNAQNVAVW